MDETAGEQKHIMENWGDICPAMVEGNTIVII